MQLKLFIVAGLAVGFAACGSEYSPAAPLAPLSPPAPPAPTVNRIVRVGVGESVLVTLDLEDFVPFDQFGDEKWERVIYVASSETVRVESRAVVDNDSRLIDMVYVGSNYETGKNCQYGPRSITCVIPANTEIPIVMTFYPGPGVTYIPRIGPADKPTFTFITKRVEP